MYNFSFLTCLYITAIISLSVILGWHIEVPTLIACVPGSVAMQYETALGLLGSVICMGLIYTSHRKVLIVVSLALLAGAAYSLLLNWLPYPSISSWFVDVWYTASAPKLGLMSPVTACMLIANALFSLLWTTRTLTLFLIYWLTILACGTIFLTALPLVAYWLELQQIIQSGGTFTTVSLSTAVAALSIGTSKLLFLGHLCGKP